MTTASAPPEAGPDLDREVARLLAAATQRYTPSRRALIAILAAADRPLTTAEVVDQGDDLPQSSVYRNLAVLESAGAVRRIAGGDEFTRFELAEDLSAHHHHLICTDCGAVADFTVPPTLEQDLEAALREAAAAAGFTADDHRLDLVGRCADCS